MMEIEEAVLDSPRPRESDNSALADRSILEMVERQARERPGEVAFEDEGEFRLAYRELAERVAGMGEALRRSGVARHSRVAIVLPDGVDMAVSLLGVCTAAIAAPLNPEYRPSEFRNYMKSLRTRFLLVQEGLASDARAVARELGITVLELSGGAVVALHGDGGREDAVTVIGEPSRPRPEDTAAILMTSGSTGLPKKVVLTHRNICASADLISRSLELGPSDCCLSISGQHMIGGLTSQMTTTLHAGGSVIYADGFDAARFCRIVQRQSPSWARLAPAMLQELTAYGQQSGTALKGSSLRFVRCGGAAVSARMMSEFEALFGVPVVQSYGATETTAQLTSAPVPPAMRKPGSVGRSVGPEIRIFDFEGRDLPAGQTGEVVARGDVIFTGYEDDPQATSEALRDGWFHTGDMGYLDADGDLFLTGRLKQMINRGGEKVNPHELETVLSEHPAVAQAAAFGIAHRTLGEDVMAAVVRKPSVEVSEQALREFAAERLSAYKVPRRVIFLGRLPHNRAGKIDRLVLTEMAASAAL